METLTEREMRTVNGGEIIIDPHTLGGPNCMGAVVGRFFRGLLHGFAQGWEEGVNAMSAR